MQQPWWFPIWSFARHALVNLSVFVLVVLATADAALVVESSQRLIASKFVIYVLIFLEYAIVTFETLVVIVFLAGSAWHNIKGYLR